MTNNNFHNQRNHDHRDNRDRDRNDNRNDNRRNHDRHNHNKFRGNHRPKKSFILLKSTVFGLFIVFITLLVAFIIVKNKKGDFDYSISKCTNSEIVLQNPAEKIDVVNDKIVVITTNGKTKEIIRFDARCGKEISRVKVSNK